MNVLVTGSAGFIGAKVSQMLLDGGHTVVGVDNLNDAYDVRLKEWRLSQLDGRDGFVFHKLDITDRGALESLFEAGRGYSPGERHSTPDTRHPPFDAVINLAARAGVRQSVEDPWAYFETNVTGTLNLLELCRQRGVGRFLLASSSSVYGRSNVVPSREDADTDHLLSPYAASKKAAEALCYTYHHLYGIGVTVFRYFTVYGPAGRPDMSPFRFVQWISEGRPLVLYGDGTQSRDFTYVDDIARGTIAALTLRGYQVINLGSDEPIVLNHVIGTFEDLVGKRAIIDRQPIQPTDVPATWADISEAKRLLGWRPQMTFPGGAAMLVEWYQDNREWAREIRTA